MNSPSTVLGNENRLTRLDRDDPRGVLLNEEALRRDIEFAAGKLQVLRRNEIGAPSTVIHAVEVDHANHTSKFVNDHTEELLDLLRQLRMEILASDVLVDSTGEIGVSHSHVEHHSLNLFDFVRFLACLLPCKLRLDLLRDLDHLLGACLQSGDVLETLCDVLLVVILLRGLLVSDCCDPESLCLLDWHYRFCACLEWLGPLLSA